MRQMFALHDEEKVPAGSNHFISAKDAKKFDILQLFVSRSERQEAKIAAPQFRCDLCVKKKLSSDMQMNGASQGTMSRITVAGPIIFI